MLFTVVSLIPGTVLGAQLLFTKVADEQMNEQMLPLFNECIFQGSAGSVQPLLTSAQD